MTSGNRGLCANVPRSHKPMQLAATAGLGKALPATWAIFYASRHFP
jgi:hypothetical protein